MRFGVMAAAACVVAAPASAASVTIQGVAKSGSAIYDLPFPPATSNGLTYVNIRFDRPVLLGWAAWSYNVYFYDPTDPEFGGADTVTVEAEPWDKTGANRSFRTTADLYYWGGPRPNPWSPGGWTYTVPVDFVQGIVINNPTQEDISYTLKVGNVPEPATWALMILGFGAIGVAVRRKGIMRKSVAFA